MLKYDEIDITEGIDLDKTNKSRECMFCHFWYFLNKNFSYGPFTCDGCYNIVQRSTDFKNIAIIYVKKSAYRVYFKDISKHKAKKIMNKFNLVGKTVNKIFIVIIKIIIFIKKIKKVKIKIKQLSM